MSIEKATEASAAEMLSTMEVRVRMFPCSGESAALKRSARERESESTWGRNNRCCLSSDGAWNVQLTLAAVALRALLGGAAPLRATAAGAARAGFAGWRHLWPWRCTHTRTHRSCCHSLGAKRQHTPPHVTLLTQSQMYTKNSSPTKTGFSNRKCPDLAPNYCRVTVFFSLWVLKKLDFCLIGDMSQGVLSYYCS